MTPAPNSPPWLRGDPPRRHEPLRGEHRAEVAVVGAGITGVTLARALTDAGATVALIEADRVGLGVSCFTTAKVSALQGTMYSTLRARFGAEGASTYASANSAALDWIAARVGPGGDRVLVSQAGGLYVCARSRRDGHGPRRGDSCGGRGTTRGI